MGDQFGLFLEPVHIRRKGRAEADASIIEAQSKAEIAVVRQENKLAIRDIEDRAEESTRRRETRRQKNIEDIAAGAAKELPEDVSENPVDQDWMAQFLEECKDISNEQMQVIWSRLLAGEVAQPGTFSLRTLAFVRTLSRDDADLFTRFCSVVWMLGTNSLDLRPITLNQEALRAVPGLHLGFDEFVRLDALGLIRFEAVSGYQVQMRIGDVVLSKVELKSF